MEGQPVSTRPETGSADKDGVTVASPAARPRHLAKMAGSHIDLRKRNAAFQSKIGKTNSIKPVEKEEHRPVPKWIAYTLLVLIVGGFGLELAQLVFNFFYPAKR